MTITPVKKIDDIMNNITMFSKDNSSCWRCILKASTLPNNSKNRYTPFVGPFEFGTKTFLLFRFLSYTKDRQETRRLRGSVAKQDNLIYTFR